MPDCTQRSASSAVRNFFSYSSSQGILLPLSSCSHLAQRLRHTSSLITDCRVIDGVVKELIQQFLHFEFAGDLRGTVQNCLLFEEVPKVFLGQDDRPDQLA